VRLFASYNNLAPIGGPQSGNVGVFENCPITDNQLKRDKSALRNQLTDLRENHQEQDYIIQVKFYQKKKERMKKPKRSTGTATGDPGDTGCDRL